MTNSKTLLDVDKIRLSFGGLDALDGVSLNINENELVSLIGPNGAGKTSTINCICKFYDTNAGRIVFQGEDITCLKPHQVARRKISRSFQNLDLFKGMTVLENVKLGAHINIKSGILADFLYYGRSRREEKKLEEFIIEEIFNLFGLTQYKDMHVGSLPYGLQKKIDIARALAAKPELLILDEPVAGMNSDETKELTEDIQKIRESKISILLIEHDMNLVMNISDRIYVINFGKNIADGTPDEVKANPDVIEIYLGNSLNN